MSLATISVAELNSIPVDAFVLVASIGVTEANAVPSDAQVLGGLATTTPVQIWSVQVHGTVIESLVPRDNGGVLP